MIDLDLLGPIVSLGSQRSYHGQLRRADQDFFYGKGHLCRVLNGMCVVFKGRTLTNVTKHN